jgi:hypothetical protein
LKLTLTDGSTIERDVRALLVGPMFDALRSDAEAFAAARVESGSVVWPNGADLCPDVLIWGGTPPTDADARPPAELAVPTRGVSA